MIKRLLSAVLLAGLATSASANIYSCEALNGDFQTRFEIAFLKDGSVEAVDAVAQRFTKDPLDPFIMNESDTNVSVGWTVNNALNRSVQYANLRYTVTIDKRSNRVRLRVKPLGYANFFTSRGSCTVRALPS